MKKIITKLIVFTLCISFLGNTPLSTYAATNDLSPHTKNTNSHYIELSNLNIENSEVEVSDVMTYEESVQRFAELNNISFDEALEKFPIKSANSRSTNFTSRELVVTLNVKSNYKPTLHFLCETTESGYSYWGILNIYSVQLVRAYNGTSYKFEGVIEFWLRSSYQIEYLVNGDFYHNSVTGTTGTFTGNLSFGEHGSISGSVTSSKEGNHFANFYFHETKSFQG